jgi:hypothetical protein
MNILQLLRGSLTRRRRFVVVFVVASLAIVMMRYTILSSYFLDHRSSPKWLTYSDSSCSIFSLHAVDDTLISVRMDGVILLHHKATLEILSRIETHGEIASSTAAPKSKSVILGHTDGSISIVRVSNNPRELKCNLLVDVLSSMRDKFPFEFQIDAIAVEDSLSRPVMVACSNGEVHFGQIDLDDNTILTMKEIPELRYGGSSVSVVSHEPNVVTVHRLVFREKGELIRFR